MPPTLGSTNYGWCVLTLMHLGEILLASPHKIFQGSAASLFAMLLALCVSVAILYWLCVGLLAYFIGFAWSFAVLANLLLRYIPNGYPVYASHY